MNPEQHRGAAWIAIAIVLGVIALSGMAGLSQTHETSLTPDVLRHKAFPGAQLLSLAGDQLLLWDVHGRAQLRTAVGTWTEEFVLPLQGIRAIEPDGGGFLTLGSAAAGVTAVVLFTAEGKEILRWTFESEPIFALAIDSRGRRAAGRAGFVTLLPDGMRGPPEPYPDDGREHHGRVPKVIEHEGRTVVCYGADLSKVHNAPGSCKQLGRRGWRFEGSFAERPLSCGPWLLVRDGRKQEGLTVRSLATGKPAGRRSYPTPPLMACVGGGELVIGERRLQLASLPSLAPRWTQPVGPSPVHDVAVLGNFVAYKTEGSSDVMLAPLREATIGDNRSASARITAQLLRRPH